MDALLSAAPTTDGFDAALVGRGPSTRSPRVARRDERQQVEAVAGVAREVVLADAYSFLQRVVGVIALALPVAVAVGDLAIDGRGIRGSISSYYYGRTGGYFVGSLCALAVFFLSYDYRPRLGHEADNRISNLASLAAVGVALFPTAAEGERASGGALIVARVHVASASVLFACLAIFSLYHFTRPERDVVAASRRWERMAVAWREPATSTATEQERRRNRIHRSCGWIIVAAMVAIVVNNAIGLDFMFWLEAIAVWAFAVSWLVESYAPAPIRPAPEVDDAVRT